MLTIFCKHFSFCPVLDLKKIIYILLLNIIHVQASVFAFIRTVMWPAKGQHKWCRDYREVILLQGQSEVPLSIW